MSRCKVVAIANQKGGTGKTTTAASLGVALAMSGKRVLLIDADPQGDLTASLGWRNPDELETTLATHLEAVARDEPLEPDAGILKHPEGVDLMPANIELSGTEVALVTAMNRERTLKAWLDEAKRGYDYALIDCMPSLGMLAVNALAAADSVIVPVQAQYLPAKGMTQLVKTIGRVKRQINPHLEIEGVLLTLVDGRTNLAKQIEASLREGYGKTRHRALGGEGCGDERLRKEHLPTRREKPRRGGLREAGGGGARRCPEKARYPSTCRRSMTCSPRRPSATRWAARKWGSSPST